MRHDERDVLSQLMRRILALELRGRDRAAHRVRRRLVSRIRRRLKTRESARLWLCLGDAAVRPATARHALHQSLRLEPDNWEAIYALGEVELKDGRFKEAEALVDRLLQQEIPWDAASLVHDLTRQVYHRAGRREDQRQAVRALREALHDPRRAQWTKGKSMPEAFLSVRALMSRSDRAHQAQ